MIAYLQGKLAFIQEATIVVDINGIGYEVICPNPYRYQDKLHEEVFIHIYHHVREDAISLYGFPHEDDKFLFIKLISVSGIGPKSAVAILGTVEVSAFISAIETEDEKYLTQFPGVGKKTARQIILDLKGKLAGLFRIDQPVLQGHKEYRDETYLNETVEALQALGYKTKEINQITPQLRQEDVETNELIKIALKLLVNK